ncbi:histidine phosphatase superfamily [Elsinoe ampelina]|uniref:Histidine phosphatase superfamily n=1 Tax=Elsinoe ampelina TaxID=302913 RepID=A0A6A6GN35_9PEZI|nr:histidine phosphatase superfamily [Elsinoe ampelina]
MWARTSLLAGLAATTAAETIHSVVVFSRHGDRSSKYYPLYQMTALGATQVYESGNFYRQRYLSNTSDHQIAGISPDRVVEPQVWASAPDQAVLYQTATNFLQGLYPPLGTINNEIGTEELTNGTSTTDPLNGYQYILVHGEDSNSPDTIWIKGDEQCPAWSSASKTYRTSPSYLDRLNSTASFYSQFEPILNPIMGAGNVSYKNAYDVFDLLNTASIHNATVAPRIPSDALDQARYLANEWEWNMNYNATQPSRSVGGAALAGGILAQMDAAVKSKATKQKFNLMAGSYDTFLAFFGRANLTAASDNFYGLPNYAATMAFELFSEADDAAFPTNVNDDLRVRFLFRNGSETSLDAYPLFGQSQESLSYGQFVGEMSPRAVTSVPQWCSTCGSLADFCVAANQTNSAAADKATTTSASKMSNAAAGGIGAGVTLAVVAVLGGLAALLMRRRKGRKTEQPVTMVVARPKMEKRLSASETSSV